MLWNQKSLYYQRPNRTKILVSRQVCPENILIYHNRPILLECPLKEHLGIFL
ncbi:unnamed protein product [Paramecium octaurelia]|uniref:Uncharacterized protein n=1 Tax=Paramecium octaurelia TaxID=43137 RepID=A0A8S1YFA7_PAROT|nr:unnamed protein product [Paramecium octaurelia]